MHEIVDAIAKQSRRHPSEEIDRATARLALLTVVDHLDAVLRPAEITALASALPLGLSLMLQRRAGEKRARFDLVDETSLRVVCEQLARTVGGEVGRALREEIADVLLGRRSRAEDRADATTVAPPTRPSSKPTIPMPAYQPRPTVKAMTLGARSEVRVVVPALRPTNVPTSRPSPELRSAPTRDDLVAVKARATHAA